jgi:cysteine desulfurase/selenocysteine lyase
MEHHSNFVPWQQICVKKKANFRVLPIDENAEINLDTLEQMLDSSVKLLAITHISNVLGTVNPVKEIIKMAHSKNIPVLLDAAQSIAHTKIDVQDLDCDFLVFSGHKMYAPMGVGVLYGKKALLDQIPPYQFGGEMIDTVQITKTTFNDLPYKFEAGTPNVEGILGLASAIDFIERIGFEAIEKHENELISYACEQLSALDFVKIIGQCKERQAVISFNVEGQHPYDVGTLLNMYNVAIRTGHHCAEPLIDSLGLPGTARISFAIYNDFQDIDKFIETLKKVKKMLSGDV